MRNNTATQTTRLGQKVQNEQFQNVTNKLADLGTLSSQVAESTNTASLESSDVDSHIDLVSDSGEEIADLRTALAAYELVLRRQARQIELLEMRAEEKSPIF